MAALCARLDGLPLAIELAAARVPVMTPGRPTRRSLRSLPNPGRRSAARTYRTLAATLDWSYHLLEPDEQVAFRALGVFVDGFDIAAVGQVARAEAVMLVLPLRLSSG